MPRSIQEIIAGYQAELEALNIASTQRLVGAYQRAFTRLETMQDAVILEIANAKTAGKAVTQAMINRQTNYKRLLDETEAEMTRLSALTFAEIDGGQIETAQIGTDMAEALVRGVFEDLPEDISASIMATFNRMPREAVEAMVGAMQEGSPLPDLLATFGADSAQSIGDALVTNLLSGRNPRAVAKAMTSTWGIPLNRAMAIARTEQLRSYRAATHASYRANAHIVKGWRWHAHMGPRTCMGCLALHGTTHTLEETLDDHVLGRCVAIPVTPSWAELGLEGLPDTRLPLEEGDGERWFTAQPEAVQRQMMGPGKLEAWNAGQYEFSQLAKETNDVRWGRAFVEAPLKDLVGEETQ